MNHCERNYDMDIKNCMRNIYSVKKEDNHISLRIRDFFFDTSNDLVLNICCEDQCYYIHDSGTAIEYLKKRLGVNSNKWKQYAYSICNKKQGTFQIENTYSCGQFSANSNLQLLRAVFQYLQYLVLVCYADIVLKDRPVIDESEYVLDDNIMDMWEKNTNDLSCEKLNVAFDEVVSIEMQNNIYKISAGLKYLPNDGFAKWCVDISSLEQNRYKVCLYDWANGWDDGSVLENFLSRHDTCEPWQYEILRDYNAIILPDSRYNQICMDFICSCEKEFADMLIKYFHMTVLLSCIDDYR